MQQGLREPKDRGGFSLFEILIAVGVISIGLLGLMGALSFAVKASRTSELASQAVGHAVHAVELVRTRNLDFALGETTTGTIILPPGNSGYNDAAAQPNRLLHDPPFENDFPDDTGFERRISLALAGPPGTYLDETMVITCTIYWIENGEDRSFTFEAHHKKP